MSIYPELTLVFQAKMYTKFSRQFSDKKKLILYFFLIKQLKNLKVKIIRKKKEMEEQKVDNKVVVMTLTFH